MKHITIIEDDRTLNNGIALALNKESYHFTQCYSLEEFCPDKQTDLIILDISLPDGNGFDFLKEYRKRSDTGNLDSKTSQDVLSLLKVTGNRFNQTIVMITHNEAIAQMANRIIRIEDGRIIKGGEAND